MKYIYKFFDVGRNKAKWTACTQSPTYDWLYKNVKKHANIMSRELDFYFVDDDMKHGVIEAGFRIIGRYEVEELCDE